MRWRVFIPVCLLAAFVGWWLSPGRGQAAEPPTYEQCATSWFEPHGEVAELCRGQGWLVHRHFVVDPHRVVAYQGREHCASASTGGPCWWDGVADGDGSRSWWLTPTNQRRFAWSTDPADEVWSWVTPAQDAVLDQRMPRAWTRCVTYAGYYACPNHPDPFTF